MTDNKMTEANKVEQVEFLKALNCTKAKQLVTDYNETPESEDVHKQIEDYLRALKCPKAKELLV